MAEEAGDRLTLYRHFASRDELFVAACTDVHSTRPGRRVMALERSRWTACDQPGELYAWYAANASSHPVYRDVAFTPAPLTTRATATSKA